MTEFKFEIKEKVPRLHYIVEAKEGSNGEEAIITIKYKKIVDNSNQDISNELGDLQDENHPEDNIKEIKIIIKSVEEYTPKEEPSDDLDLPNQNNELQEVNTENTESTGDSNSEVDNGESVVQTTYDIIIKRLVGFDKNFVEDKLVKVDYTYQISNIYELMTERTHWEYKWKGDIEC